MRRRKGSYGIDAPYVPAIFVAAALVALVFVVVALATGADAGSVVGPAFPLVLFAAMAFFYLHSTFRGKFDVWDGLLDGLRIDPGAKVLDLGCGRGAVLLAAAERLGAEGRADGIDLWRSLDQSGNSEDVTRANAVAEGVPDRVELHTGDLRELPFADASYDVVVSSLAIHNIPDRAGREQAALEGLRVLRPGGQLVIVDLPSGRHYLELLRDRLDGGRLSGAGWRMWWGGPYYPSRVLTGTRPTV